MKKEQKINYEKVLMLTVWKEGAKIKFHSTADIDNFALFGFLTTYIQFLQDELLNNMASCNDFNKDKK